MLVLTLKLVTALLIVPVAVVVTMLGAMLTVFVIGNLIGLLVRRSRMDFCPCGSGHERRTCPLLWSHHDPL